MICFCRTLAVVVVVIVSPAGAAEPPVEYIGPPTRYMEDITRYDAKPAPQTAARPVAVTRQSYLDFIGDDSAYGIAAIVKNPDHGQYGVRHAFPALAQYDAHERPEYAQAIKTCLKSYEAAIRKQVEARHWHECYMFDPTLLCMYRQVFQRHKQWSDADEQWFKEFFLWLNRTVHVWGGPEDEWRGPMHRATGEGVMKALAVQLYPDAPDAARWRHYAELQWNDWWPYRDNPINDTGYFLGQMFPMVVGAHLLGRDEVFRDPQMRLFWDRLIEMTTPDGAVIPFGPAEGWNSQAGLRLMALEAVAAKTGDGRYRFVAHRIFNYLLGQRDVLRRQHILDHFSQVGCALAWFLADDSIKPVPPSDKSAILYHKETLRVRNKATAARYLKDLDPDPHKAQIDCGLLCTDRSLPFKLCLRSGWKPGDLYMLVDLFPRHEPMNPTGVLGLVQYNSVLATSVDSKAVTDWLNMLRIDDLSGKAPRVKNTDRGLADTYYMDVTVPVFADDPLATYAKVVVKNYNGFPMTLAREFFFIKNRFVLLRDTAVFEQAFAARLGPVWYTQNVGPHVGPSWATTYIGMPLAQGQRMHNPPLDLLVYHAPKADRRLQIIDETADVRRLPMPYTLRYVWEGQTKPGEKYVFTQLLLPSVPQRKAVRSNAPGAATRDDVLGHGAAAGVEVIEDSPARTVWKLRSGEDRTEWLVLNDSGTPVDVDGKPNDAQQLYLDASPGKPPRIFKLPVVPASPAAR